MAPLLFQNGWKMRCELDVPTYVTVKFIQSFSLDSFHSLQSNYYNFTESQLINPPHYEPSCQCLICLPGQYLSATPTSPHCALLCLVLPY